MMKLSTMWSVVNTLVDTKGEGWACPLAEVLAGPWEPDPDSVRFFRASANFVCTFRRGGKRHFLRFSAASERPRAAIEAEMRLLVWLDRQGIRVAAPVLSRHGRHVETTETELGTFHAVVFEELAGSHLELDECGEPQFRAWGATLGKLHAVMSQYRDPSVSSRETWRDHLALAAPYVAGEPALKAEWQRLHDWAEALPDRPAAFGLIHFDFESDNLCWQEGTVGILDFDDCSHHWYAADIAYALRDLFAEGADLTHPSFQAFVAGYRSEFPVQEEQLARIPMFLRLHDIHRYGRLSRALDLPDDREPPEWLKRIDTKLKGILAAIRDKRSADAKGQKR